MDVDTHFWLSIASWIVYYAIYPLLILGTAVAYLVRIVASPFIYLAFILQEIVLLPLRFLAKFEASNVHTPTRPATDTYSPYGTSLAQQSLLAPSLGSCCIFSAKH